MSSTSPLNPHPQDAAADHNTHAGSGAAHKAAHPAAHHDAHRHAPMTMQHAVALGYVPMRHLDGPVTGVWGDAQILGPDGHFHALEVGHVVQPGEVILTGQNGIVEIHGSRFGADTVKHALAQPDNSEIDITPAAGPNGGATPGSLEDGLRVGRDYESVSPLAMEEGPLANAAAPTQQPTIPLVVSPPDANPDAASTPEDTPITLDPRSNDTSSSTLTIVAIDGHPIAVGTPVTVEHGTVTMNQDGSLTFTPDKDYHGTQTFTYTEQSNGGTASSTVTIDVTPVNDAPVAVGDTQSTDFEKPVTISVLSNDTDADGDKLTVTTVDGHTVTAGSSVTITSSTGVTEGTATLNSDGTITFTPAHGYTGDATFTYGISDGNGGTSTATVTVTVGADHAPVAVADTTTTEYQTPVTVTVLHNDTDVDGDTLTVTTVDGHAVTVGTPITVTSSTGVTEGTATVNADGTITFTPAHGYTGDATFTYGISDGNGGTSTATVTVTVGADHPPAAVADTTTTDFQTPVTVTVLGNDTDVDGDTLTVTTIDGHAATVGTPITVTSSTGLTEGTATLNSDGTITFTPAHGYTGDATFTYGIDDGNGGTSTATVTVTVGADHPPVAVADSTTTEFQTPVNIPVLGNDTDADGDTLTVTTVDGHAVTVGTPITVTSSTGVTEGTATVNTDGTITFTPDKGFTGDATFTYGISDGNGGTSTATVTVTVGADHPPVANPDTYEINTGASFTFDPTTNDTDVDHDTLSVTAINGTAITSGSSVTIVSSSGVTEGTVTLGSDGKLIFTPADGYDGDAKFNYTVADGHGGTSTSTIEITAPHATSDTASVDYNTAKVIDVLANDTQVNGAALHVSSIDGQAIATGGSVTVTSSSGASEGTVTLNNDGTLTFTPATGYTGAASFTYTATDGTGTTNTATVNLVVDTPPVAVADTYEINTGASYTFDPTTNDTDVDHDTLSVTAINGTAVTSGSSVTIISSSGITEGTVTLGSDGKLTFTPAAGYDGDAKFNYTITDGHGGTSTSTIEITAPHAANDTASVDYNTAKTIDVLANDTKVNGASLTVSSIDGHAITTGGSVTVTSSSGATEGTVTLNNDGTLTFTPATGYTGTASFTYTATDGTGTTNTATVNLVVDTPPVAVADTYEINTGASFTFDPTTNDTDANHDALSISAINGTAITTGSSVTIVSSSGVTEGTVTLGADGKLTFAPASGYDGDAKFTYTVTDGHGGTSTSTIEITAPHAANDTASVDYNTAKTIDVLANDTKVNGAPLHVSSVDGQAITAGGAAITVTSSSGATEGTVALNSDGTLTFTPATGYTGAASFTYTATDGTGTTNTATVNLVVDTPPVAVADTYEINTGASFTFDPTTNDADANHDALSISAINGTVVTTGSSVTIVSSSGVTEGTVTLGSDGKLTFVPASGYDGDAKFNYTVTDGHGGTSTSTIEITAPHAADDPAGTIYVNGSKVIDVLANDTQAVNGTALHVASIDGHAITSGGAAVTITSSTGAVEGTVTLNADGTLTFTAATGYTGPASFTYTATDGQGTTNTATVSLTVAPLPVAKGDTYVVAAHTPLTFDPTVNDTHATGTTLTITQINGTAIDAAHPVTLTGSGGVVEGTVSLNSGGTLTYTPAAGYTGPVEFSYTVTDGNGHATTANVDIATLTVAAAKSYDVYTDLQETGLATTTFGTSGSAFGNPLVSQLGEGSSLGAWHTDNVGGTVEVGSIAIYGVNPLSGTNPDSASTGDDKSSKDLVIELEQNVGDKSNLYTTVSTVAGEVYKLDFDYAARASNNSLDSSVIKVYWEGQLVETINTADPTLTHYSLSLVATTTGDSKLEFIAADSNSYGGVLDDIHFQIEQNTYEQGYAIHIPAISASFASSTTSEAAHFAVSGIPAGSILSDGTHTYTSNAATTSYDVSTWNLSTLTLTPADGTTGDVTLHVTASTSTSSVSQDISVDIVSGTPNIYGGSGNDTLVGTAGNDTLDGGAGNDKMTGGAGSDVFQWHLGDAGTAGHPAVDTITDFNTSSVANGGDVLDLRDLLQGGTNTTTATSAGDLTNYLHFEYSGGNTTIHVSSTGGFTGGTYSAANEDETIVLQNVNLVNGHSDSTIITELLNANKLITGNH